MMPDDDYSFVGGGSLKLKGVKESKVDKKKRKRKKHAPGKEGDDLRPAQSTAPEASNDDPSGKGPSDGRDDHQDVVVSERSGEGRHRDSAVQYGSKTAAELRHEERRRKMLHDRLSKEGTKTHKERVEELNRYLSGLSEHHDMPRIGPG